MTLRVQSKESPEPTCPAFPNSKQLSTTPCLSVRVWTEPQDCLRRFLRFTGFSVFPAKPQSGVLISCWASFDSLLTGLLPSVSPQSSPQYCPKRSFYKEEQITSCSPMVLHFQQNRVQTPPPTWRPLQRAPTQPSSVASHHFLHHTANKPPTTQPPGK